MKQGPGKDGLLVSSPDFDCLFVWPFCEQATVRFIEHWWLLRERLGGKKSKIKERLLEQTNSIQAAVMLMHHGVKECSSLTFWKLPSRLSIQFTKNPTLNLQRGILIAIFCILSSVMVSQLHENHRVGPWAVVPSTWPVIFVLCYRFAWTLKRLDRLLKKSTLTLTILSIRQLSWRKTLVQIHGLRLHHFFMTNLLPLGWSPAIMCP